jgi:hypothetical protein
MSNTEGPFGPDFGRSRQDPITSVFMAMRDAWVAAVAPRENMSGPSTPGVHPGTGSPVATLFGPMISVLGAMADVASANRPPSDRPDAAAAAHPSPGHGDPGAAEFLLPVGQAMMIAANRSASYWFGLAQIFESHQAKLAQFVGAAAVDGSAAGAERLVTADELRALLREVGDLAAKEARLLQNELGALDESLAQSFQQPDASGAYRRRWRSKV